MGSRRSAEPWRALWRARGGRLLGVLRRWCGAVLIGASRRLEVRRRRGSRGELACPHRRAAALPMAAATSAAAADRACGPAPYLAHWPADGTDGCADAAGGDDDDPHLAATRIVARIVG